MESETPTSAGQPPTPPAPVATPASVWVFALPALSLALTLGFWYQTRQDLNTLAEGQRRLAAELDEARGMSTISVAGAPAKGPADQVVTLIEFSDYECPFCVRHFTQTMPQIEEQFIRTGRIRYVFKDFPIDQLHPAAIGAHEAARCANEQGKFWEMHARMFSAPGSHTEAALEARATEAGLALAPFKECLASDRTLDDVRKTIQLAVDLGANGTPAFFVGLRDPSTETVKIVDAISGAQPFEAFEKAIRSAAARVQ
jgi:protein-disulfide isomerase